MAEIPSGWFLMGEDAGPRSHRPQRRVYLSAYAIDCTEVTNAAFGAFVADTGYQALGWDARLAKERAQTFFRDSSHSARPNPRVGFRCASLTGRQ